MDAKKKLVTAALTGLVASTMALSGCTSTPSDNPQVANGECHGINSCKGKGACGGADHACAGKNSCKGKGWVSMSAEDCIAKNGTFKAKP